MTYIAIIVQSLFDHIKLPVFSWVISYSCSIEPVSIVAADVMVHLMSGNNNAEVCTTTNHQPKLKKLSYQQVFKPLSTQSPVQLQVFGEKAGYVLASSVGHESCQGKLPHVRIYKWHSCSSLWGTFVEKTKINLISQLTAKIGTGEM